MRIFAVGTKIFGGPGQHLGGPVPPGPNVEPPLCTPCLAVFPAHFSQLDLIHANLEAGMGSSRTLLELEDSSRTPNRGLGLGL